MKAYSLDLRERVVRAVDQGKPRSEIVKMLGVSLATIKRYLKQRRETGHVRPKAIPGRPAKKGAALQAGLLAQLEAHPDASLEMHCELWENEHSRHVSTSTMSRMIERVGWTRKKSRWQPANGRRRNERSGASR
jgi:transposase